MVFLDKYGWPVTQYRDKPFINFLRRLIHTRKIVKGWFDGYQVVPMGQKSPGPPVFSCCTQAPDNMQDLLVAGVLKDCPEILDPTKRAELMKTHGPGMIKPGPLKKI